MNAMPPANTDIIVIGERGTAFPLLRTNLGDGIARDFSIPERKLLGKGWDKFACDNHAKGKRTGVSELDCCFWVSPKGKKFTVCKTADAINRGLIVKRKANVNVNGTQVTANVYLIAADIKSGRVFRKVVACDGLHAGRVELYKLPEGRVSGGAKMVKNGRFEIPAAAS